MDNEQLANFRQDFEQGKGFAFLRDKYGMNDIRSMRVSVSYCYNCSYNEALAKIREFSQSLVISAYDSDDPELLYEAGENCLRGWGTRKSKAEALMFYEEAAVRGHLEAQYMTARCYGSILISGRNKRKAKHWLRTAIARGHVKSMFYFAMMIGYNGNKKEKEERFTCLLKASLAGHKDAFHSLGNCYEDGEGTLRNLVEACAWFLIENPEGRGKILFNHTLNDRQRAEVKDRVKVLSQAVAKQ